MTRPSPLSAAHGPRVLDADLFGAAALVLLTVAVLYAPTVADLWQTLWQTAAHSHGPLALVAAVWLFAHKLRGPEGWRATPRQPRPVLGWAFIVPALFLYVIGRSQSFPLLEMLALLPLLVGCTLVLHGAQLARNIWFAYAFLLFLVPLPGTVVDAATQPLKLAVSWASELLLDLAGYPIARSGVILMLGQYKLLVADACAGLNSIFMVEACSLLYLNVVRHPSALRNVALAVLIVPISFVANVVRVLILALVTYHFGDEAGQGFVHDFAGIVLFISALLLTVAVDSGLRRIAALADRQPARLAMA